MCSSISEYFISLESLELFLKLLNVKIHELLAQPSQLTLLSLFLNRSDFKPNCNYFEETLILTSKHRLSFFFT